MSCNQFRNQLHPWLRGELSTDEAATVQQHVAGCHACASIVENEKAILNSLKFRYEVPAVSPGFEKRVMTAATGQPSAAGHRRSLGLPVVGGAVAAALALGVSLGVMFQDQETGGDGPGVAQSPVAEGQVSAERVLSVEPVERTVRLAFRSAKPLENVTMTLRLPPNVELASFPGRQEVSWKVSLDAGENVLALPLKVLFPGSGELVARLDTGERQKTFRAMIPGNGDAVKEGPGS